jgi:hypothetical protein
MTRGEKAWREVAARAEQYIETLVELRMAQDKVIDLLDAGHKAPGPAAWRLVVLGRKAEVERIEWQAATTNAKAAERE